MHKLSEEGFTNAENVEAKSIDDRFVDKLVREGIEPNMSVQFQDPKTLIILD